MASQSGATANAWEERRRRQQEIEEAIQSVIGPTSTAPAEEGGKKKKTKSAKKATLPLATATSSAVAKPAESRPAPPPPVSSDSKTSPIIDAKAAERLRKKEAKAKKKALEAGLTQREKEQLHFVRNMQRRNAPEQQAFRKQVEEKRHEQAAWRWGAQNEKGEGSEEPPAGLSRTAMEKKSQVVYLSDMLFSGKSAPLKKKPNEPSDEAAATPSAANSELLPTLGEVAESKSAPKKKPAKQVVVAKADGSSTGAKDKSASKLGKHVDPLAGKDPAKLGSAAKAVLGIAPAGSTNKGPNASNFSAPNTAPQKETVLRRSRLRREKKKKKPSKLKQAILDERRAVFLAMEEAMLHDTPKSRVEDNPAVLSDVQHISISAMVSGEEPPSNADEARKEHGEANVSTDGNSDIPREKLQTATKEDRIAKRLQRARKFIVKLEDLYVRLHTAVADNDTTTVQKTLRKLRHVKTVVSRQRVSQLSAESEAKPVEPAAEQKECETTKSAEEGPAPTFDTVMRRVREQLADLEATRSAKRAATEEEHAKNRAAKAAKKAARKEAERLRKERKRLNLQAIADGTVPPPASTKKKSDESDSDDDDDDSSGSSTSSSSSSDDDDSSSLDSSNFSSDDSSDSDSSSSWSSSDDSSSDEDSDSSSDDSSSDDDDDTSSSSSGVESDVANVEPDANNEVGGKGVGEAPEGPDPAAEEAAKKTAEILAGANFYPSLTVFRIGVHPLATSIDNRTGEVGSQSPHQQAQRGGRGGGRGRSRGGRGGGRGRGKNTTPEDGNPAAEDVAQGVAVARPRAIREYVTHCLSDALDTAVFALLQKLAAAQRKLRQTQPLHYKARMRFVTGLKETLRGVKVGRVKLIIVAPDIEPVQAAGGLDDHVNAVTTACKEHRVPMVYALSRRALGVASWLPHGRISSIAIFSGDSAYEELRAVTSLAKSAREEYGAIVARAEAPETADEQDGGQQEHAAEEEL